MGAKRKEKLATMTTISNFMSDDHRRCDDVFAEVEQALAAGDWAAASERFSIFTRACWCTSRPRKRCCFRPLSARPALTMGPTQVMRNEYVQMRALMDAAAASLAAGDAEGYSGNAETLLIMMQQHNMKEKTSSIRCATSILPRRPMNWCRSLRPGWPAGAMSHPKKNG